MISFQDSISPVHERLLQGVSYAWEHVRYALVFSVTVCFLLPGSFQTALGVEQTIQHDVLELEKQAVLADKLQARPIDLSGLTLTRPVEVDYSSFLTYIRNQVWGGGCMTYSTLHAADIINEFQAPYTPDLSWQYVLRTWDDLYNDKVLQGDTTPPTLNDIFNPGVASEGLCRSESDYLTRVPKTDPKYDGKLSETMFWDPAPSAEARQEAGQYRFAVSEPITPDVETLKTLLITHGPVWASGQWWWGGAHAMTFVGYNDVTRMFKIVDSSGDWAHTHGILTIPYDKLTSYVSALRTVTMIPTTRYAGRWAYSSRIRIRGAWRGTWTVRIGVEGQEPLLVYRTYGRKDKVPYAYGDRLDLDVPLPDYAAQFWPPKAGAKWYLQVEDNDRDNQTGYVMEWTLARRYQDPDCLSVDQWKTETFTYAGQVTVPDAKGDPVIPVNQRPSQGNTRPYTFPPNAQPGVAILSMPDSPVFSTTSGMKKALTKNIGALQIKAVGSRIVFDDGGVLFSKTGQADIAGRLQSSVGIGLTGKKVGLYQLIPDSNVNKPRYWKLIESVTSGADGRFAFSCQLQPVFTGQDQVYGVAYKDDSGETLCSSERLIRKKNSPPVLDGIKRVPYDKFKTVPPVLKKVPELKNRGVTVPR